MSSKKKDLEIIYNLSWKNKPKREDEQLSIIAVYDIPATTLNFEVFKSYLLKNSGTPENNVKVSYLLDNGKEYPIQSQTDFQIALYSFRRKARSGEVINLLLERISDQPLGKNLRHSNDVETQFDTMEPSSMTSVCCHVDTPPEWFLNSVAQLKKEITEDVTAAISSVVSTAVANVKPHLPPPPPPCYHFRKNKPDKRIRKGSAHLGEHSVDAKDVLKSMKLDHKLEKLERKATKYREKRVALQSAIKSSDSELGHSSSRSRSRDRHEKTNDLEPKMGAKPVNTQKVVPHMLGGEVYLHQWEVQNTGEAPWNAKTNLQYTWGSKSLIPAAKVIAVPPLKPGEKGTIAVRLQVPAESGSYECYWQFMHNNRRFGHWLGCQIVVDPFNLKGNRSVLETSGRVGSQRPSRPQPSSTPIIPDEAVALKNFEEFLRGPNTSFNKTSQDIGATSESTFKSSKIDLKTDESAKTINEELVHAVTDNLEQINFEENDYSDSNSSEDENFSLLDDSASSKNSFKDEFVVVPVPKCFIFDGDESSPKTQRKEPTPDQDQASTVSLKSTTSKRSLEGAQNGSFDDNNNASTSSGNSIKLRDEDLDNVVVITVPKDDQVKEGYIYVHVDGQKVLVPKNILKSEVVNAANALTSQPGDNKSVGVLIESNESVNKSGSSTVPEEEKVEDKSGNAKDGAGVASTPQETSKMQPAQEVTIDMPSLKTTCGSQNDLRSDYFEANNYTSHCSAAGSCFSDINAGQRVFVFPLNVPGYEAVNPADISDPIQFGEVPTTTPRTNQLTNPFNEIEHIPNFQQSPPEHRPPSGENIPFATQEEVHIRNVQQTPLEYRPRSGENAPFARQEEVHILPEALVNGAVNVASSAINTARSVINMIKPQTPGNWVNGHWVSNDPQTPREVNLNALAEMGFWNRDLNATLLARYNDDLNRVVAELVQ